MKSRLAIVTNTATFFLTHRLGLAREAQRLGHPVAVITPDGSDVRKIRELGFEHKTIFMGRKTINPLSEIYTLYSLYKAITLLKPEVIHTFTIKPNIYVALLSRFLKVNKIIVTITGLGSVYVDQSIKGSLLRLITGALYKIALSQPRVSVIFQNTDDRDFFIKRGWAREISSSVIHGTGVDTEKFKPSPKKNPSPKIKILFASRFLRDKGMIELISAGQILQRSGCRFEIQLCGELDPGNPSSLTDEELENIKSKSFVHLLGYQNNMLPIYQAADIVCLPSYREGLPLSLIEAAACGLPIVTTDVPGCRDVVIHGENGFLAKSRDAESLATFLTDLIASSELRKAMGQKSRELALKKLRAETVLNQIINLYNV